MIAAVTLQLCIAGNFQVVKKFSREKILFIDFKDFTDLDFFYTDIFFHFLDKCVLNLLVTQSVCCTVSS